VNAISARGRTSPRKKPRNQKQIVARLGPL
jgi:hypothetical protein